MATVTELQAMDIKARRLSRSALCGALAGLTLLASAAPTQAALVLAPATLKVIVNTGFHSLTTTTSTGPASLTGTETGSGATVTAFVQVAPATFLQSSMTSIAAFGSGGSAQGVAKYYFGVSGPLDIIVPIHMLASLHAVTSVGASPFGPAANAQANLGLVGSGLFRHWGICASALVGGCGPSTQDLSISDTFSIMTNRSFEVTESAYVAGRHTGVATATADPYFFIDADFLTLHPDYKLLFSPGVGNKAPGGGGVPEPATWALMLTGFAAVGSLLRNSRRRNGLAAG